MRASQPPNSSLGRPLVESAGTPEPRLSQPNSAQEALRTDTLAEVAVALERLEEHGKRGKVLLDLST